jgi:hypothetical protein
VAAGESFREKRCGGGRTRQRKYCFIGNNVSEGGQGEVGVISLETTLWVGSICWKRGRRGARRMVSGSQ